MRGAASKANDNARQASSDAHDSVAPVHVPGQAATNIDATASDALLLCTGATALCRVHGCDHNVSGVRDHTVSGARDHTASGAWV